MNRKQKIVVSVGLIIILILLVGTIKISGEEIILANKVALRIRVAVGGFSVLERIEAVNASINEALSTQPKDAPVKIKTSPYNDPVIYIDTVKIITVTTIDTEANAGQPEKL